MTAVPFREALYEVIDSEDIDDNGNGQDVTAIIKGPGLIKAPSPIQRDVFESIGAYRLGSPLGHGGMAEVFAATHSGALGFQRAVCIKRILPNLALDSEFRALFAFEAQVAGTLCHSNIVQVFDCIEHGETLALIMEMIDGIDLKGLLRRLPGLGQTVPAGVVAYIAGQLLTGLRYAHSRKIVHRDVSPHNILVSREGEIKLADFGVAKAMITHATRKGTFKGKLAYMSPEQATARPVDHRTDLYSAGLVLYELLMGKRFFPPSCRSKLFSLISNARQPRLPGVEPNIAMIIEGLLAPSPSDRFQTAQEALDALPPWEVMGPVGAAELATLVHTVLTRPRCDDLGVASSKDHGAVERNDMISECLTERLGDTDRTTKLGRNAKHSRAERPVIPGSPDMPTVTRARVVSVFDRARELLRVDEQDRDVRNIGKSEDHSSRTRTGLMSRRHDNCQSITIVARNRRRSSGLNRFMRSSSVRFIALAGLLALLMGMSIGACGRVFSRCGGVSVSEVSDG